MAVPRRWSRWREARRIRRTKLPWHELEAEAARQGCGAVDIFFDRAGRGRGAGVPDRTAGKDR